MLHVMILKRSLKAGGDRFDLLVVGVDSCLF